MFSSFRDTFIKKPQYEAKPPQAVIDAISAKLPEGFRYEYVDEGFCRLEAIGDFNIQSGKYSLPEKARAVLSENATYQDIMSYCHNSQTPLALMPDAEGGYVINGERFKANELVKAPLRELEFESARMVMFPAPLNLQLRFHVEGNGYRIPLVVNRVPNESVNIQKFESDDSQPVKIIYYMDPSNIFGPFTFTITLQLDKAKTTESIICAYEVFNAFMNGKGSIEGNTLETKERRPENIVPNEVIDFWKRLREIEKILSVEFDVTKPLKVGEAIQIEGLYRSLIERKPFKTYRKYNSISGSGEFQNTFSEPGKNVYFEYEITETMEILGQEVTCCGVMGVFGATVTSSTLPDVGEIGKFVINLEEVSGQKMYDSKMYFLNMDDLKKFQEDTKHVQILQLAEEIKEPDTV